MQTKTTGTRNTPAKFSAGVEVLGAGRLAIEVGERQLARAASGLLLGLHLHRPGDPGRVRQLRRRRAATPGSTLSARGDRTAPAASAAIGVCPRHERPRRGLAPARATHHVVGLQRGDRADDRRLAAARLGDDADPRPAVRSARARRSSSARMRSIVR